MKRKIVNIVFTILLLLALYSCKQDGSLIESPPEFLQFVEAPEDGDTLTTDNVTISWVGGDEAINFRYKLDYIDFSDSLYEFISYGEYLPFKTAHFKNLDDGHYIFSLMGINAGIEGGPETLTFYIDALIGTSMRYFPRTTNTLVDSVDTLSIMIDDVANLIDIRTIASFDTTYLELISIEQGVLANQFFGVGNTPLYSDTTVIVRDTQSGNIKVTSGLNIRLSSGNQSISGSGEVLNLIYKARTRGETILEFISMDFLDDTGKRIQVSNSQKAVIKILERE